MNEIKENNFFIPRKLSIGFQKRTDTYTGKLGFVTYYDNMNKLRKETSWKKWRDLKIDPMVVDNEPVEGFIINRTAGGGTGWDARATWTRIWDPRGFEFEISVENLLWILDWCDSLAGKKLQGKFVYSWYGTELVLMPVISDDYKKSMEITNKMYDKKSFKEKDLIPGTLYKFKGKTENELVYIGKVEFAINFGNTSVTHFVFSNPYDNGSRYWSDKNITSKDCLYVKKPVNIIAEMQKNYYNSKKIDEYLHRFEISPYSVNFWKNIKNIVDKFVPTHPSINDEYNKIDTYTYVDRSSGDSRTYIRHDVKLSSFDHMFKYVPPYANPYDYDVRHVYENSINYLKSVISEDGKSVIIKEKLAKEIRAFPYIEYNKMFDFASIDLNTGEINKICDPGCCVRSSYYSSSDYTTGSLYPFREDLTDYNKAVQTAIDVDINDNRTFLYYVTQDGYVSDELQSMLIYDINLRFNPSPTEVKEMHAWDIPTVITLPRKIKN